MRPVMRQVGVVLGLTVILTFPVTVVSGPGSTKHSDQIIRTSQSQWAIVAQAEHVSESSKASAPVRAMPRR